MQRVSDSLSVQRAIEVSSTPESARYLSTQFTTRMDKAGISKSVQELAASLNQYAVEIESIKSAIEKTAVWSGVDVKTAFSAFQAGIAIEAGELLNKGSAQSIAFSYAVEDTDSKLLLLRGSQDEKGNTLDEATVARMDELFLAWMSEHKFISENGAIYLADSNGSILKDKDKQVKARIETFNEAMADNKAGFSAFVKEKTQGNVTVSVTKQDYPKKEGMTRTG